MAFWLVLRLGAPWSPVDLPRVLDGAVDDIRCHSGCLAVEVSFVATPANDGDRSWRDYILTWAVTPGASTSVVAQDPLLVADGIGLDDTVTVGEDGRHLARHMRTSGATVIAVWAAGPRTRRFDLARVFYPGDRPGMSGRQDGAPVVRVLDIRPVVPDRTYRSDFEARHGWRLSELSRPSAPR